MSEVPQKTLKIRLPEYGRAYELLRVMRNEVHGELVVNIRWDGEIHVCVYDKDVSKKEDFLRNHIIKPNNQKFDSFT